MFLESGTSTPDKNSLRFICNGSIKPHEQRALNFLINEYLLLNSYKLTSITFADENQHQVRLFLLIIHVSNIKSRVQKETDFIVI